jgi:hypothetical protein
MKSWKQATLHNRERLSSLQLWGQSAAKVRAALKMPTDRPIVMTGHQPVFFHPGLWVKCLAASHLAQAVSGIAYHKVTNTAMAPEYIHYLPELDDKIGARKKELDFFVSKELKKEEKAVPYTFLHAPEPGLLQKILSDAMTYGPRPVKDAVPYFAENLMKGFKVNSSWDNFHLHTLSLLDDITGTNRFFLQGTDVWDSEPFLDFVIHWCTHMMELGATYNEALNDYRKREGITHELEPMPNLRFENWFLELPFWITSQHHHRDTLWAKIDGKTLTLKARGSEGQHAFHLNDLRAEMKASSIKIWPKALTQTLFCRMYLCDFFIHGLGGGVYEQVGDLFFQKEFQIEPPAFGVASATYFVDPKAVEELRSVEDNEKMMQAWIRALEQNPEYLFFHQEEWRKGLPRTFHAYFQKCLDDPELAKLADEKLRLVADMKDPVKRAEAGKALKLINPKLYGAYGEILAALAQGLQGIKALKETRDVMAFREYPFFCYGKEVFLDMQEKIKRETAQGWT